MAAPQSVFAWPGLVSQRHNRITAKQLGRKTEQPQNFNCRPLEPEQIISALHGKLICCFADVPFDVKLFCDLRFCPEASKSYLTILDSTYCTARSVVLHS